MTGMHAHRLRRLGSLTQGAALIGLGVVQSGCSKDAEPPHINAPADTRADLDATSPTANSTGDASITPSAPDASLGLADRPPTMNAPAPTGSAPRLTAPPHTNAPPRAMQPDPAASTKR